MMSSPSSAKALSPRIVLQTVGITAFGSMVTRCKCSFIDAVGDVAGAAISSGCYLMPKNKTTLGFDQYRATGLLALIMVVLTTTPLSVSAEMLFKYKASSFDGFTPSSSMCYDSSNIGSVGTEPKCDGMLIISRSMLYSSISNRTYKVESDGVEYTLADSENNVFTGQIEDMSLAFANLNFNRDIGYWDVSNVKNMEFMFGKNSTFNQDIGSWDVSSVDDMRAMFYRAYSFNQDIGSWDVSNVSNMEEVFRDANAFNRDIAAWDVSGATNMHQMFRYARSFNKDISGWDVSNVTSASAFSIGAPISGTEKRPDFN